MHVTLLHESPDVCSTRLLHKSNNLKDKLSPHLIIEMRAPIRRIMVVHKYMHETGGQIPPRWLSVVCSDTASRVRLESCRYAGRMALLSLLVTGESEAEQTKGFRTPATRYG